MGTAEQARQTAPQSDKLAKWARRELYDVNGKKIGTVVGQGYLGTKFGTAWLLVETEAGNVLVPVAQIDFSRDRLSLPYPKTYVESGPGPNPGPRLSKAQERRLCLHYGYDAQLPGVGCLQGCGLCRVRKQAQLAAIEG
jgi:hypothetical protein